MLRGLASTRVINSSALRRLSSAIFAHFVTLENLKSKISLPMFLPYKPPFDLRVKASYDIDHDANLNTVFLEPLVIIAFFKLC